MGIFPIYHRASTTRPENTSGDYWGEVTEALAYEDKATCNPRADDRFSILMILWAAARCSSLAAGAGEAECLKIT
jgi:hypothetical protein